MTRYIFYLRLKEEYVDHEPEHVVQLASTTSVIAETESTALDILKHKMSGFDRYTVVDTIADTLLGTNPPKGNLS